MKSPRAFGRSGVSKPRYRFGVFWLPALGEKKWQIFRYRKTSPDIKEPVREKEKKSQCAPSVHWPACLTLCIWEPFLPRRHIPTVCLNKPGGKFKLLRAFLALYPSSLVCPIWGPAGTSPDLFMRCLSSHRRVKFFKSPCPAGNSLELCSDTWTSSLVAQHCFGAWQRAGKAAGNWESLIKGMGNGGGKEQLARPCLSWQSHCTFTAPVDVAGWTKSLPGAFPSSWVQHTDPAPPKQIPRKEPRDIP